MLDIINCFFLGYVSALPEEIAHQMKKQIVDKIGLAYSALSEDSFTYRYKKNFETDHRKLKKMNNILNISFNNAYSKRFEVAQNLEGLIG